MEKKLVSSFSQLKGSLMKRVEKPHKIRTLPHSHFGVRSNSKLLSNKVFSLIFNLIHLAKARELISTFTRHFISTHLVPNNSLPIFSLLIDLYKENENNNKLNKFVNIIKIN